ncbi:MAG: hopanoid C-3 methylase HpnR, partial [Acidimicrobiales bacterium]
PYPGTELWHGESPRLTTRDYRLFDIQHAVLPTHLPLRRFYEELVRTQAVIDRKHLGLGAARGLVGVLGRQLAHGQTNFLRSLWRFSSVYTAERQHADHLRDVRYELPETPAAAAAPTRSELYVHRRASASA